MLLMMVSTLTFVFTNVLLKELKGPLLKTQPQLSTEGTRNLVSTSASSVGSHIFQTRILRMGSILKHGAFRPKSAAKLAGWTSQMGPSDHRLFVRDAFFWSVQRLCRERSPRVLATNNDEKALAEMNSTLPVQGSQMKAQTDSLSNPSRSIGCSRQGGWAVVFSTSADQRSKPLNPLCPERATSSSQGVDTLHTIELVM